jgi:hypothetical protein
MATRCDNVAGSRMARQSMELDGIIQHRESSWYKISFLHLLQHLQHFLLNLECALLH